MYVVSVHVSCVWLCVVCVCVCVDHDFILTQQPCKGPVESINCMCGAVFLKKPTKGSVLSITSSAVKCTVCQQLYHSQCIDCKPTEENTFVCINCLLEKVKLKQL